MLGDCYFNEIDCGDHFTVYKTYKILFVGYTSVKLEQKKEKLGPALEVVSVFCEAYDYIVKG